MEARKRAEDLRDGYFWDIRILAQGVCKNNIPSWTNACEILRSGTLLRHLSRSALTALSVPGVAAQCQDMSGEMTHPRPQRSMRCPWRCWPQRDLPSTISPFFQNFPSSKTCRTFPVERRREVVRERPLRNVMILGPMLLYQHTGPATVLLVDER